MAPPQSSAAASQPSGALPRTARPDRQPAELVSAALAPGEALARAVAVERRETEKARRIKASEELRRRAVNPLHGQELVLGDELRRRLEQVIHDASPAFEQDIRDRLGDMRTQLAGLNGNAVSMIFLLPSLHELTIDIKGMGGTFGYHLLTDLAKSLEALLAQVELPTSSECDLIAVHVDAMYMLLMQRIRGQGGDLERQLLISLGYASDRIAGDDIAG